MSPKLRDINSPKPPINRRLCEFWGELPSEKISSKTGVNAGTIRGYLNGRQTPSAEFLAATAELGGDVHYILTGKRSVPNAAPTSTGQASGNFASVVRQLGEIESLNQQSEEKSLKWDEFLKALDQRLAITLQEIRHGRAAAQGDSPAGQKVG